MRRLETYDGAFMIKTELTEKLEFVRILVVVLDEPPDSLVSKTV